MKRGRRDVKVYYEVTFPIQNFVKRNRTYYSKKTQHRLLRFISKTIFYPLLMIYFIIYAQKLVNLSNAESK